MFLFKIFLKIIVADDKIFLPGFLKSKEIEIKSIKKIIKYPPKIDDTYFGTLPTRGVGERWMDEGSKIVILTNAGVREIVKYKWYGVDTIERIISDLVFQNECIEVVEHNMKTF